MKCKECVHYDFCKEITNAYGVKQNPKKCKFAKPAANEVEERRGEWIFEFGMGSANFYACSVCGRQEGVSENESPAERLPYCHCGAKMDVRGEQ